MRFSMKMIPAPAMELRGSLPELRQENRTRGVVIIT